MTDTITIKNNELIGIANFLRKATLKNVASLVRTRLIKLLSAKQDEVIEDTKELAKRYAELDEKGQVKTEIVKDEEGNELPYEQILFKSEEDEATYSKEYLDIIQNRSSIIDVKEHKERMLDLLQGLYNLEDDLKEEDAFFYSELLEALETLK